MTITPDQEKKYVEQKGLYCPFCESMDIESDHAFMDETGAYMEIECKNCGEKWTEVYELIGISNKL